MPTYFIGELRRIAELLGQPLENIVEVVAHHDKEHCYITFVGISALGQAWVRVDYGCFESQLDKPLIHYTYNSSNFGVQRVPMAQNTRRAEIQG